MKRFTVRIGLAGGLAAALAFASMMYATPGELPRAEAAPAKPVADELVTLQEFATFNDGSRDPRNTGFFFTANQSEAASAVSKFHFTKVEDLGRVHTAPGPNRVAVHRLRLKSSQHPSYMLAIADRDIKNTQCVDEGVIGWIDDGPEIGDHPLLRFSYNNRWAAAVDTSPGAAALIAHGFHSDGPIGFVAP
ncbi:hypothetical protein [Nocardia jiangxiensis]|uniref:Uncharacterized protein n=1 Tax=Nocardia jiangxiensis TaxID=282685 RepID=A0ABW6SA45_9NOCA|nr:hypothetical protein [Nocardia jiangxiensis]